jgi:hypothetical protein
MITLGGVYEHKILTGKFDGKRKPRCTWEDNIKMNGKEIRYESMD